VFGLFNLQHLEDFRKECAIEFGGPVETIAQIVQHVLSVDEEVNARMFLGGIFALIFREEFHLADCDVVHDLFLSLV